MSIQGGTDRPVGIDLRVPLVGDAVVETASYWLVDTQAGTHTGVDIPPFAAMESPFWFARQGVDAADFWCADCTLNILRRGPDGRRQTLYKVDPTTGAALSIIDERDDVPVLLNADEFAKPNWRQLRNTGEYIWYAQRDGWPQLYLHEQDGTPVRQIAAGAYVQRDLLLVDENARTLWTSAQGLCPSGNPYNRHLLRIPMDGGPAERLTEEPLDHVLSLAPDGVHLIDHMGGPDTPSRIVLRAQSGVEVMTLAEADAQALFARGYKPPETVTVCAADGATPLRAAIYTPSDFDPQTRYPVLDMIYGWSQVTVVPHGFLLDTGGSLAGGIEIAAENALMPQATAELGFVVVVIDARGTPFRDRNFWAAAFKEPTGEVALADHCAAIRNCAKDRPWMDLDRVGICGHSGGGFMAAKAMMQHADFFKAGVASAGNHDMRLYHAAWAAVFGATPDQLARAATPKDAALLKGPLMIAHGDRDENVHIAHSIRLVDALIAANKDFDFLVMPGRGHDFTLDPYFVRRRWDHLVRHVMQETPPPPHDLILRDWNDVT